MLSQILWSQGLSLVKAVGNHRLPADLIHPTDRGVQYASSRYRALLKNLGMAQSMSRKGNCYDNAMTEFTLSNA
jgi:transposase InsO family protein